MLLVEFVFLLLCLLLGSADCSCSLISELEQQHPSETKRMKKKKRKGVERLCYKATFLNALFFSLPAAVKNGENVTYLSAEVKWSYLFMQNVWQVLFQCTSLTGCPVLMKR